MVARTTAVALGLAADRLLGEPPADAHPVALFGRAMSEVESRLYEDDRRAGVGYACAGVAARCRHRRDGALDGGRHLRRRRRPRARRGGRVPWATPSPPATSRRPGSGCPRSWAAIRRPSTRPAVARAVVESVAENTVDAVVAPALWAAAAGAPGVLVHRAINTMDAMVGHHDDRYERFGWAAARLDDAAAWLPARATATLVATCRPRRARAVWRAVRRDAGAHPSPNSGVAEAAFAGALGLRLGGESRYGDRVEVRPPLGDGRPPTADDIGRAVALSRDVTLALAATLLAVSGLRARARARMAR